MYSLLQITEVLFLSLFVASNPFSFGFLHFSVNQTSLGGIYSQPFDPANALLKSQLTAQLHDLWQREELHWQQCSRLHQLQKGDRNTHFFHLSIIQRRNFNRITWLQSFTGVWIEQEAGLQGFIRNFYCCLFFATRLQNFDQVLSLIPPLVTPEINDSLLALISNDDVRHAVFELSGSKALSPDSFSGLFYQRNWQVVGPSLCAAIRRFYDTGFLLKEFNRTNIVLISKC